MAVQIPAGVANLLVLPIVLPLAASM